MKPVIQDGALVGIDVLGSTITFSMEERELIGKVTTQSTVTSLTPELKRVGLARMFSKLGQGLKVGKDIDDALSDTRLDEFVHKFGKWINVASFGM